MCLQRATFARYAAPLPNELSMTAMPADAEPRHAAPGDRPRVGYLLNTYPVTSATFIRREIQAIERRGWDVVRYAVRRWDQPLVAPEDEAEAERTHYVLTGNAPALGQALVRQGLVGPAALARALPAWRAIARQTDGAARAAAYLAQAAYLLARSEADGVRHVHCHWSTNTATVAMLCRLMGGPTYSFTAHGPDEFVCPERIRFDLKVGHAAFVVAITHYARMQLIRWGGIEHRDKIIVGRCGLDLDAFESHADTPTPPTFVCVGRLCPQKGQTLIPEAVEPLAREFPDLRVVLIGDGETRPQIEAEIAARGLEETFELTGWMANAEVRERLANARALLLPSFAEGLPVVIMEAMAQGRPAISTYIAGIPELVDPSCGWLVPASSVDDLRAAMRDALTATPRRLAEMGREGRRRVEASHDVDALAGLLTDRFEAVLAA